MNLEKLALELSEANKHLSEYADQVQELTITQERNRLAREIHDGLGHYLTTINMQIKAANAIVEIDREKAKSMLENAQNLTSAALIDVRNSVYALRQDPEELAPLDERIKDIANSASTPNRKIYVNVLGEPRKLSVQIEATLIRAAQETINNANKHSNATRVDLTLDYSDDEKIVMEAVDDGIGKDEIIHGFGLIGIQERVRLLNGSTNIQSSAGKGFQITIMIPGEK